MSKNYKGICETKKHDIKLKMNISYAKCCVSLIPLFYVYNIDFMNILLDHVVWNFLNHGIINLYGDFVEVMIIIHTHGETNLSSS